MRVSQEIQECGNIVQTEFGGQDFITQRIKILERFRILHKGEKTAQLGTALHTLCGLGMEKSIPKKVQSFRQIVSHLSTMHDRVEHPMFQKKFAALKTRRKLLPDCLFNDSGAGETNQSSRLGNIEIA